MSNDEIQQYLDTRYVGPPEACWRIFRFPLYGKSHKIERLPVHDDLQKNVYFHEGEELDALEQARTEQDMLEGWFC